MVCLLHWLVTPIPRCSEHLHCRLTTGEGSHKQTDTGNPWGGAFKQGWGQATPTLRGRKCGPSSEVWPWGLGARSCNRKWLWWEKRSS